MSLLSSIGAILLALVIAGATGFYKGDAYGTAKVRAEWGEQIAKDHAAIDAANVNAQAAAELYEEAKAKQITRTVVVTKEVNRALEAAPDWASVPVPAGVRNALAASAPSSAASEPDGGLRVRGAGDQDQRPTGGGLRFGPRSIRGLFGAASGSGQGG